MRVNSVTADTSKNKEKSRRMGHLQGSIAADLLLPAARERFEKIFAVAARKSVFTWSSAAHALANVVLIDDSVPASALGHMPPCVVCLCKTNNTARTAAPWQARLSGDYTVADLIDILDRAAVFLLDWQARPSAQRLAATSAAPTPAPVPAAAALYRLGSWVSMGAPFNSHQCLRALALLAQGAVSARQISEHSGLEPARTTALLNELQQRGVLISSAKTAASATRPPPPRNTVAQPSASVSLVQRLSRWLNNATGQRA